MSDLGPPAIRGFSSLKWRLLHNAAVAENELGRTRQRLERDGVVWLADLNVPRSIGDDSGVFTGWLAKATKPSNRFFLTPPHAIVRGAWSPADLVTNGTFLTGLSTGWAGTSATLSINARRLKVKNTGAAAGRAAQNLVMEAGKPHVVLADIERGIATAAQITVVRQSDSVAEGNTGVITAPTRAVLLVTPTVAAMALRLLVGTAVAADDVFFGRVSVARCLQVTGAGQVGSRLNVDGAPANTNAALKAGEFVCFLAGTLYQLVQLTEDFDTDAGGAGTLAFEPPLRASPADNAAVIVRYPFARMYFPKHGYEADVTPPVRQGITMGVEEDITP